jgi:hypothetical protein
MSAIRGPVHQTLSAALTRCGLALILLLPPVIAAGAANTPNFSGFWAVRFEQTPSGQDLIDQLPAGAVIINDAGAGELGKGDFAGLRLTERSLVQARDYNFRDELKRENTCVDPSVIYYMQGPFPMEVDHGVDLIVFRMEYFDMVRVVYLDGRGHPPPEAPHTKSGHSIGHWEGDTLVVDTTHIAAGTIMNNGLNHSDNIHMVERFRMSPDGQTLWLTQVYEDPEVFEGLAARYMAWRKVPGEYIYPYECDPSYGE